MKKLLLILGIAFYSTNSFACGGCQDAVAIADASSASVALFLGEESATAGKILQESVAMAKYMVAEKSNDITLSATEEITKDSSVNKKNEIFLLELNNKLEGQNVNIRSIN